MRIIQLDSVFERIFWTFRSWLWGYPVPLDLDRWELSNPRDTGLTAKEVRAAQHSWKFLEPFFTSRGYTLYRNKPPVLISLLPAPTPSPPGPKVDVEPSHPFARRVYKNDIEAEFPFMVNAMSRVLVGVVLTFAP